VSLGYIPATCSGSLPTFWIAGTSSVLLIALCFKYARAIPIVLGATKFTYRALIAFALMQPQLFPSNCLTADYTDSDLAACRQPDFLKFTVGHALDVGVCVLLYAVFGMIQDARSCRANQALLDFSAHHLHKSSNVDETKLALAWTGYVALIFVAANLCSAAISAGSDYVGCDDLCGVETPTYGRMMLPWFFSLAEVWICSFLITMVYIQISSRMQAQAGDPELSTGLGNALWWKTGNVAMASVVPFLTDLLWIFVSFGCPHENCEYFWGCPFCCCWCDFCPIRRGIRRYNTMVNDRFGNRGALQRTLSGQEGYMQATRTLLDQTQDEDEHAALAIMTGDDLSDMFAGFAECVGILCAIGSLTVCDDLNQCLGALVTGGMIGSAIPLPLEAVLDNLLFRIDRDAESFAEDPLFQKLMALDDFEGFGGAAEEEMEPITPVEVNADEEVGLGRESHDM